MLGAIVLAAVVAATPSFAADWYVKPGGSDSNDGQSWATAFATVQQAVAVAVSDAEIWIRQGTYVLTSSTTLGPANDLAFYGGFAGTETLRSQRSGDATLTIIDGQNSYARFSLAGDSKLEPADVWVYTCTGPAEADDFVNTHPMVSDTTGDEHWSEGDPFTGVQSKTYWSSSEATASNIWSASLSSMYIDWSDKESACTCIWPVRPR